VSSDPRPPAADVARLSQAWDWVLRLRGEAPEQDVLNDWLVWYEADPRNKQAFDQASAIASAAPEAATDLRGALAPTALRPPLTETAPRPRRRRRTWIGAALAAGLGIVALQFGLQAPGPLQPLQGLFDSLVAFVTPAEPMVKRSVLPDGSQMELASKSKVQVHYNDRARLLTLRDGVAHFTVAHNPERPFIVRAGDVYVRAVGTAFNVRHSGERVVVTVTEGTVEVYPAASQREPTAPPPTDALRLQAGKEVVWAAATAAAQPRVTAVDPSQALAWREGRLEYLNEPLASAIADINRYASRQIIIRDPAIGDLVFSGAVRIDSVDIWVQSIPQLFPVALQRDADGNIVLIGREGANG
jgi:transmembrane sensor